MFGPVKFCIAPYTWYIDVQGAAPAECWKELVSLSFVVVHFCQIQPIPS